MGDLPGTQLPYYDLTEGVPFQPDFQNSDESKHEIELSTTKDKVTYLQHRTNNTNTDHKCKKQKIKNDIVNIDMNTNSDMKSNIMAVKGTNAFIVVEEVDQILEKKKKKREANQRYRAKKKLLKEMPEKVQYIEEEKKKAKEAVQRQRAKKTLLKEMPEKV